MVYLREVGTFLHDENTRSTGRSKDSAALELPIIFASASGLSTPTWLTATTTHMTRMSQPRRALRYAALHCHRIRTLFDRNLADPFSRLQEEQEDLSEMTFGELKQIRKMDTTGSRSQEAKVRKIAQKFSMKTPFEERPILTPQCYPSRILPHSVLDT